MESCSRALSDSADVQTGAARPRVLIDARKILDGGIGTYTANLIEGLLTEGLPVGVVSGRGRLSGFSWHRDVELIEDESRGYSLGELLLGWRLPKGRFDIFHEPHYTLPYGVAIPAVVTIHDVIHLHEQERAPLRALAARFLMKSAIRRASQVIVVSRSTAADLLGSLSLSEAESCKITFVPNAVREQFVAVALPRRIESPYFLTVCSQDKPHKGLGDLLTAFHQARALIAAEHPQLGASLRLVVAGLGVKPESERASPGLPVEFVGAVSDERLRQLYCGALGVVIPSLREGFGLMVLEAHSSGVPVVVRPVPALRELLGPYDISADDFSVPALTAALRAAFPAFLELRDAQSVELRASVESFRPRVIARQVRAVYESSLDRSERGADMRSNA